MGDFNLARLAEQSFERHGDHEALFFEGRWYRSGELHERARRVAGGLEVAPGDRVVVFMENGPDVGVVYQAAWRAGAVVTPVIFLLPPEELRRIVADARPRVIVTSALLADRAREAAGNAVRIVTPDELAAGEPAPIVDRADDALAALIYTGGTTGRAKGVMLTHANLWHAGRAGHDHGYVPGIVRSLTALPLSHAYGLLVLAVGLHAPEPGRAVLMRWF